MTTTTPTIALVTGGNRGLGRSTALALAADGIGVVLTYRSHADEAADVVAEIAAAGGTAVALGLDTGELGGFSAFVDAFTAALAETWGRDSFDILVNNAGLGIYSPIATTSTDDFDTLMNVHVKGVYFLTQAVMPLLADGARIVNLSTGLTRFTRDGYAAYALMKGAVEVFTRYLALELGPRGITANTVAPGPIATDFGGGGIRDNAEVRARLDEQAALGRVGLPEDVGAAIAALVSPGTAFITGQRIEVSGGALL